MADAYLKWVNKNTRGHDDIIPADDYDLSWADGLCFCALFYAYFPEKIPIKTLKAETDEDKLKNLELAFKVGEEAGIEPLLDPDDTMTVHDKKSIMLYISEIYGVLKDAPVKFQASAEWNKKYDADEKQRKFAEWKLKKEVESKGEIYIAPPRTTSSRSVQLKQAQGGALAPKEAPKPKEEPAPTPAPTTATVPATHPKGRLSVHKTPAPNPTPAPVTTPAPAPAPVPEPEPVSSSSSASDEVGLSYEISGRGKEGGNEGRMCIFTVTLKLDGKSVPNPVKEDLKVFIDCPGGPPRLNIMGGSGGSYHVGFTPTEGGQYWCDFVWRGNWSKEPYMLPVKTKTNLIPDHPYTGAERKAAGASVSPAPATASAATRTSSATAKAPVKEAPPVKEPSAQHSICSGRTCEMTDEEFGTFDITCKDNNGEILAGEYQFDVKVSGPSQVESKLVYTDPGTYKCTFGPANAGKYTVEVSYKGQQLNHGTWGVNVLEAIGGIQFEEVTILFHTTKGGIKKTTGGDLDVFKIDATGDAAPEIIDLEDGRYTLDYQVAEGENAIDVQAQGKSIAGFPLMWSI